jgi:hypothetical protein
MKSIIGAAMLAVFGAAEQDFSANRWLPYCKSFITPVRAPDANLGSSYPSYCAGEVEGLAFASCARVPPDVTASQAVRVVVRYIEQRPQRMHESFLKLAPAALINARPCRD